MFISFLIKKVKIKSALIKRKLVKRDIEDIIKYKKKIKKLRN
jgi:hypothetical protein